MTRDSSAIVHGEAVLRHLARALLPFIQDELKTTLPPSEPAYYSQHDSPLGRRRHLALVRSGQLEGKKVGRLVLVPRKLVHAFIESHRLPPLQERAAVDDPLSDWDLTSRRKP